MASSGSSSRKGLLERLAEGLVVGDGSFVMTLEKRGYVLAGNWTPEACVQYPDAVRQLHREFLRAGADVMQTFTFWASEDRLKLKLSDQESDVNWESVNEVACDLAHEVAAEGDALVAGSVSSVPKYEDRTGTKEEIQNEFRKQCDVFIRKKVDFLLGEFFAYTEEAEWAVEVMKSYGVPVACTMRVGVAGDEMGVAPAESAVRLARAGADVVGVNCCYDPDIALDAIAKMKTGLEEAGLKNYLMIQPVGFHTQDLKKEPAGYTALPEFPFALEPRALTRIDVHKYARRAYDLGVRYIGGCCGFEPHHIRAIAEELKAERGRGIPGADKFENFEGLRRSHIKNQHKRTTAEYWLNLKPAAGREWINKLATLDLDY
ncbi:betaine--homocysteine S-methyltransferase 1-like [Lytechinus variegatus]|uniref:betaine--homocysteine S-methyltransferase 1-like n=1 Tax=Lytechinus variegatus TaxID=7654 RepID=UPI001BB12D62|nr:betaine--homocysteine S-methyltransferase 1-like [Lytechinus variegatus]